MMLGRIAFATALCAGVALAVPATADEIADAVAGIPASVADIRIAGAWESDGDKGVYRIVITRIGEMPTARFFVQWIADDNGTNATVANSIEISEVAEFGLDIKGYTTEVDADGLSVFAQTFDPNSGAEESYELFVFSPTDYRFDLASN